MSSITVNQKNKSIVINSKGSTSGSLTLAGAATGGETVNEMFVTDMFWSVKDSAAHWEIDRGANTVLTVHGNGKINLQEQGLIYGTRPSFLGRVLKFRG